MEEQLKTIKEYFELINLKAFCEYYGESYEFTRQVFKGNKDVTEKFINNMIEKISLYQERQREIYKTLL